MSIAAKKRGLLFVIALSIIGTHLCYANEPVKVAAIFSLTGIAAKHNAPLIPMLQLGIEEINETGGLLGRPLELILLDNQSTPIGSNLAAKQAVRQNVTAVIGAHWSSHSLSAAPVLQEAGIPMISPGSTNPDVTLVGDYIFRVCFLDSFQGQAMARFARTVTMARTAIVLKNIDETYSLMLGEYFTKAFLAAEGKIAWEGAYRGKAVDFSKILDNIDMLKPDVVYVPGYTRDSGLLISQAKLKGIKTTFMGGDAWDEIYDIAGDAVDGSYQTAPWHPEVPFERSRHLKERFRQKFGSAIQNYSAPLAYDAIMLLKDAIERAGNLDRVKIRQALADTTDFKGATGAIRFDANGDPLNKAVIILKLQDGVSHYVAAAKP
jgi:branched-chain amino acid transport system substrate-binding protein